MNALEGIVMRAFEDEMLVYVGEFSPPLAKTVGDEQLRRVIRLGVTRAFGHGLTYRGPVRLYLELMLLFGSHFDTDPQYRWAKAILTDRGSHEQMQRARLLYQKTLDYRQLVTGPDDIFTFGALEKVRGLLGQAPAFEEHDFVASMLDQIHQVYPQKAAYVGQDDLELLIQAGMDQAAGLGFTIGRETALFVTLMLSFGHGCADDPLYPWIARTLRNPATVDRPARTTERLARRTMIWLDHVLANNRVAGA